jgi:hypothetical protein
MRNQAFGINFCDPHAGVLAIPERGPFDGSSFQKSRTRTGTIGAGSRAIEHGR